MAKPEKRRKSRPSSTSRKATPQPASTKPLRYRAFGPNIPLAPGVTFDLKGPGGTIPAVLGLVDSGADGALFPEAMMGPLGIAKKDCTEIDGHGAGGKCKYWFWPQGSLTAEIEGKHVKLPAMFGMTERVILGRADFFRVFKVSIDERKQRFRLDPY